VAANPGENHYTSVQNFNVPTLLIGGTRLPNTGPERHDGAVGALPQRASGHHRGPGDHGCPIPVCSPQADRRPMRTDLVVRLVTVRQVPTTTGRNNV
jgi:hypothetical protein